MLLLLWLRLLFGSDAERARDVWDGDFGEDEKGEFCDAVGSGGWHGGRLMGGFGFACLVWFLLVGWMVGWLFAWLFWFVGLRSAKWMDAD